MERQPYLVQMLKEISDSKKYEFYIKGKFEVSTPIHAIIR